MNPLLFVYGTLLSTVDHPTGDRLRREAAFAGLAVCPGRLYQVDWYPGLVDDTSGAVVHGELYRLHTPYRSLVWLDEFEGVTPGISSVTAADDYERVERTVRTGTDDVVAWVYRYQRTPNEDARIPSGRWSAADA